MILWKVNLYFMSNATLFFIGVDLSFGCTLTEVTCRNDQWQEKAIPTKTNINFLIFFPSAFRTYIFRFLYHVKI